MAPAVECSSGAKWKTANERATPEEMRALIDAVTAYRAAAATAIEIEGIRGKIYKLLENSTIRLVIDVCFGGRRDLDMAKRCTEFTFYEHTPSEGFKDAVIVTGTKQ